MNELKNIDPKYIDVPNICFSRTKPDDDREDAMKSDRIERGFDDSETWCLASTCAEFMIPRLERFIEITNKVNRDKDTDPELLLAALKLIVRDDGAWNFKGDENKVLSDGLNAFPRVFMNLWW